LVYMEYIQLTKRILGVRDILAAIFISLILEIPSSMQCHLQ
jgi:hypothetical protein